MAKISQKKNASSNDTSDKKPVISKAKRTRKTVQRDSPPQRSSIYRGVTRHRWTGRYEAHLWDKNCWNESQNKKGRQVYLGAYDDEKAAAHAYDLAALKYWGQDTILNFPLQTYEEELREMDSLSKEEYIGSLRRKSSGFSRGVSKYRGVARHHHNGRWEARIGRVFGNKYLYLGTYATQEEAATAYDMAAIEYRGLNAVTNFDLSRYIKWLRPDQKDANNSNGSQTNFDLNPPPDAASSQDPGLSSYYNNSNNQNQQPESSSSGETTTSVAPPPRGSTGSNTASSALGLLFQSTKFKEMLERTSVADSPSTPPESDLPRRSFPDDIQTYFDCSQESNSYAEGEDNMFAELNSFAAPMFQCELDLNLKGSFDLVSFHHLSRLPNLETLILSHCISLSLTHVCESIGGLKKLSLLDFGWCNHLGKVASNKNENQLLVPLPDSLKILFLNDWNLDGIDDDPLFLIEEPPFFYNHMNLVSNPLMPLTNYTYHGMLRVFDVSGCRNIKSLLCLPSTLEELYTSWCFELEKITFESAQFRLRKFEYQGCDNLGEIQGFFKLVPLVKLDEADLGHLKWIKTYQNTKVNLTGDVIRNFWQTQVLYEYGIMSTYLAGIKDQNMARSEYMSTSAFLSFRVPSCPEKSRIRGLNITASYRISAGTRRDDHTRALFTKVSNTTKGLTWMYNPAIYDISGIEEDAMWLSYWPIGNTLDAGDEINVSIIVGDGFMVSRCGASLAFIDDGEVEPEYYKKNYKKEEEVIGGDLSEFQLTTGAYYLCRRNYFKSTTSPGLLNMLFGDTIPYTDLLGWRKSLQTDYKGSFTEWKAYRDNLFSD